MKNSIFLILAFLSISCGTNNQVDNANSLLDENIGWMHGNCLAIKNDDLKESMNVRVVKLADDNVIEDAIIIRKANSAGECFPLMDDRREVNISSGYSFYLVDPTTPVDLAIAIVGEKEVDASNFDFCSTSEGIEYFMKDSSETTWEGYYYLGYGTEVTCQP